MERGQLRIEKFKIDKLRIDEFQFGTRLIENLNLENSQ